MGWQIVKQPDGKYVIWSSIVDDFIVKDLDVDELIEFYVENYREEITKRINNTIALLEKGEKPYHQFTMTWEECFEVRERRVSKK